MVTLALTGMILLPSTVELRVMTMSILNVFFLCLLGVSNSN